MVIISEFLSARIFEVVFYLRKDGTDDPT